jgi:hypothetical protein
LVVIGDDGEVGDEGVAAGCLPEELVGHQPGPENLQRPCMCGHRSVSYMSRGNVIGAGAS